MDWTQITVRRDENHLRFVIWRVLYWRVYGTTTIVVIIVTYFCSQYRLVRGKGKNWGRTNETLTGKPPRAVWRNATHLCSTMSFKLIYISLWGWGQINVVYQLTNTCCSQGALCSTPCYVVGWLKITGTYPSLMWNHRLFSTYSGTFRQKIRLNKTAILKTNSEYYKSMLNS